MSIIVNPRWEHNISFDSVTARLPFEGSFTTPSLIRTVAGVHLSSVRRSLPKLSSTHPPTPPQLVKSQKKYLAQLSPEVPRPLPSPLRFQLELALPMMASKMLLRTQTLRSARPFAPTLSSTSSRSLASVAARGLRQNPSIKRSPLTVQQSLFRQSFRRQYADSQAPKAQLSPPAAKPKKRWSFFRMLWRITYLSLLGGTAYLVYTIYDLKHPNDQFEPDPSKKTLVVLGRSCVARHGGCWS